MTCIRVDSFHPRSWIRFTDTFLPHIERCAERTHCPAPGPAFRIAPKRRQIDVPIRAPLNYLFGTYLAGKITGPQAGQVVPINVRMIHFKDVMRGSPMLNRGLLRLDELECVFGIEKLT